MERSIVKESVVLDENGEGYVKYPPIKKYSVVSDKPVKLSWETGRLTGNPVDTVMISYISLCKDELGE